MTTEEAERQLKEAREHLYEVLDEMESNNSSYDSYSTTTYGTDSTDTEEGSTSEGRLDEALDALDNLSNTVVQEVTGTPLIVTPFAIAFGGTILWNSRRKETCLTSTHVYLTKIKSVWKNGKSTFSLPLRHSSFFSS
ncbi:hypothetical protein IKG20_01725 [Candidatus Saccharibacteria bacterium]|nr:hypothetical protein [Candidatus Saccharibacteria bacterium]